MSKLIEFFCFVLAIVVVGCGGSAVPQPADVRAVVDEALQVCVSAPMLPDLGKPEAKAALREACKRFSQAQELAADVANKAADVANKAAEYAAAVK